MTALYKIERETMKKIFLLLIATVLLSACTSPAEEVMAPLQYKQPIEVHIPKTAYLYWQSGVDSSSVAPSSAAPAQGIVGALVGAVVETEIRKNNPGKFTFTYGKPQQAVFMTSFKNVLEQNHVFNNVELVSDLSEVPPQAVLITVYFKSTRVLGYEHNYQIVLDVDMKIKSGNKGFNRTYLVASEEGGFFSSKSFKDQQTDVSQKLLSKLITGITQFRN